MPVAPHPSDPDSIVQLQIRIPGWLKNEILERAEQAEQSINVWTLAALHEAVRPPVVRSERLWPTAADVVADYLHGEPTVAPCGKRWPCEGANAERSTVRGTEFCGICNVRLTR